METILEQFPVQIVKTAVETIDDTLIGLFHLMAYARASLDIIGYRFPVRQYPVQRYYLKDRALIRTVVLHHQVHGFEIPSPLTTLSRFPVHLGIHRTEKDHALKRFIEPRMNLPLPKSVYQQLLELERGWKRILQERICELWRFRDYTQPLGAVEYSLIGAIGPAIDDVRRGHHNVGLPLRR